MTTAAATSIDAIREYLRREAPEQVELGDLATEAGVLAGVRASLAWAERWGASQDVWRRLVRDLTGPEPQPGRELPREISWRMCTDVHVWNRACTRGPDNVKYASVLVSGCWRNGASWYGEASASLRLERMLISGPYEDPRYVYTWRRGTGTGVLGELLANAAQRMISEEDCAHIHQVALDAMEASSEGEGTPCLCDLKAGEGCPFCSEEWHEDRAAHAARLAEEADSAARREEWHRLLLGLHNSPVAELDSWQEWHPWVGEDGETRLPYATPDEVARAEELLAGMGWRVGRGEYPDLGEGLVALTAQAPEGWDSAWPEAAREDGDDVLPVLPLGPLTS